MGVKRSFFLCLASFLIILNGCSKDFTGAGDNARQAADLTRNTGSGGINGSGQSGSPAGWGVSNGELQYLQVSIEYVDPYFMLDGIYPGYYIGLPMNYRVHLTNTGSLALDNLDVTATHEYRETATVDRWWYPYPEIFTYDQGQAMPGNSTQTWTGVTINAGQEVVLVGTYLAPLETGNGLDQTHLTVKHSSQGLEIAPFIYDNPTAGIFCPPPPKS